MKKTVLLVLLVIFAFAKTSFGQKGDPVSIIYFDIRYEFHPCMIDIEDRSYTIQKVHCGRFGFAGFAFLAGRDKNIGIEWMPVSFMGSSAPGVQFDICFLNFSIRAEKGRFCPALYTHLCELEIREFHDRAITHHTLSGGFEFYISNISLITCEVGIRYEMPGDLYYWGRLSPFVGIGYKLDLDMKIANSKKY